MPVILICDNGSTQPGATLQLRHIANQLSGVTGKTIHPVSLQHANTIPADKLDGQPANTFTEFIETQLSQGERSFIVLPVFFGNSKALTSFIPEQVTRLEQAHGNFALEIAEVIYPLPHGEPILTDIIIQHIQQTASEHNFPLKNIVLVDHGSPVPRVTEVRKHLAQSVQLLLTDEVQLEQAVMERREGREYDFNGDLLEDWLSEKAKQGESDALVIMMFFLPGRHAGNNGDVVEICEGVMHKYPGFKVAISPLIGEHPLFIKIIEQRLHRLLDEDK